MINTGEKETLYIVLYGNVHTKYSVFLLDETIFLCYNRFDFLRKERKKMNVIKSYDIINMLKDRGVK